MTAWRDRVLLTVREQLHRQSLDVCNIIVAGGTYGRLSACCLRFGRPFANQLRRRRPRPADKLHLNEVFIRVQDKLQYLWGAVDQHGQVLEILVQSRRDARVAARCFRTLLRKLQYESRVIVTGKLCSYRAAKREILPGAKHRQSRI